MKNVHYNGKITCYLSTFLYIYCKVQIPGIQKSWNIFLPATFFPGLTSLLNSLPSPPLWEEAAWQGMRGVVNASRFLWCSFCLKGRAPHILPLLQQSLSHRRVLHNLPQFEFYLQTAVLHKLLQWGSLPWDAVLQEQTAPVWVEYSPFINFTNIKKNNSPHQK